MKKLVLASLMIYLNLGATIELVEDNTPDKQYSYFQYLKGTYQHAKKDYKKAFRSFQHILSKQHSVYVFDGFLRLLYNSGQFPYIAKLQEMKKKSFTKAFDKNLDIKLIFAQTYLRLGDETKASKLFTELSKDFPDNPQVAYYTAVSLIKQKKVDEAIKFINASLKKATLKNKHFLFLFLKSKIHLQRYEHANALRAIEKSLKLFPRFDRGWLFKAILMEQLGRVQDAVQGYKRFLTIVGRDPMIEKQLIQLLFAQKDYKQASEYLKKIKSDRPEYFYDLAVMEFKARHLSQSLAHVNTALAKNKNFKKAKLLKMELLLSLDKQSQALAFMKQWLLEKPKSRGAIHTFTLLRRSKIEPKKLAATLEQVIEEHPQNMNMQAALADIYTDGNDHIKALNVYNKMLPHVKHPALKSTLLFHIGFTLFTLKQYHKIESILNKAMEYEPTHPSIYNLLAYYYAVTNQKLKTALKLIDKALSAAPNRAYYLDTKGFVLHKMGQREQSIATYEQAYKIAPLDPIIKKHLMQAKNGK